jgi:hypothetical protein
MIHIMHGWNYIEEKVATHTFLDFLKYGLSSVIPAKAQYARVHQLKYLLKMQNTRRLRRKPAGVTV